MRALLLPVLLCALLPDGSWAAQRSLKGRVVLEGGSGEPRGVAGVTVILTATGDRDTTDSQGLFRLHLSEKFQPGESVNLAIDANKKGWRLYFLLDGDINIPANPDKQLVKLGLLPTGSKRFCTDARIEKFLKDRISEVRAQTIQTGEITHVDMGRSTKDWAEAYGFSASDARAEIDKWVDSIEKRADDTEKLALAAFAKGNFSQASELLGGAGTQDRHATRAESGRGPGLQDEIRPPARSCGRR